MPLIKLFTKVGATKLLPLPHLQSEFQKIWGASPEVLKVLVISDCSFQPSFPGESVYVDVRAKRTPARSPEVIAVAAQQMAQVLSSLDHKANIRIELFDPPLSFLWKPSEDLSTASKL
eukprot:CAMPEP_0196576078 /NCGR_PEP_ID=MMETSP1081-20130531/5429_1 /TAXON_ID=36882 /ORGANISM="Pyramimonas amylifera, Strain CCMP720" /LENGTH=117 /DNA_ID=CAMNT_0041894585 /DNA_START=226 /DNA_END=579 /DNA_ORIENTATION=+